MSRRGSRQHVATRIEVFVAVVFAASIATSGCNKPPAVNPWREDSIPATQYGTASSNVICEANVQPVVRQRDFAATNAPNAPYDVPHYPLWWEDPFEDQGDNDQNFAWTWQDYLHMPYGLGRFILNTIGTPASMLVTLPGTPMVSDGIVGKVHDAKPGQSPDPTAGPENFGFDGTTAAPPNVN